MVAYGPVLTQTGIWWWMVATVGTRLAVCAVPLGVIFAAEAHTGSYAWGAVIAGAYAAGEAVGAPFMGARFQRRPLRGELACVATAEAIALVGVVVSLSVGVPLAAVVLAGLGGGVASGVFGGLRTVAVTTVPESRQSVLALDTILNQACQVVGPALAAATAVAWTADAPLLIVSCGLMVAVAVAIKLPERLVDAQDSTGDAVSEPQGESTIIVIRAIWPSLTVIAMVLMIEAVLEVTLPAILEQRNGPAALAGVALSGLAIASIVGSFTYGLRRWRGRPHQHTLAFASLFAVTVAVAGLVQSAVATVALVAAAGLFQAPASTARGLAVTDALPPSAWPVGFSLLYSCGAAGFTFASALSALFLATNSAAVMLIILGVVGLLVFMVTGWREQAMSVGRD